MIERRFGASKPLSIGVEEELMILDGETLQPAAAVGVLVAGARELDLPGTLKTELHASVVELTTDVCDTAAEAVESLRALRAAADSIARANGLRIAAAGAHPTAPLESLPVVDEERYLRMVERVGRSARRQGVNGLHVHVGVESADACWERLEAVLPWLPGVLAVSANSPFVDGEATGMLSNRAGILTELPRAGAPPTFAGYAAWESWVERLMSLGVLEDHTRIWWDVRPNPRFGTLELRIADQPTSLTRTALVVELLRDLVAGAPPCPSADRGVYLQNRWSAARHGVEAELVHPTEDRLCTPHELLGRPLPEPEALLQLRAADPAADLVERTLA
ncbi:MAG TPA: YbdK family carboxylate-amine ligase [Gaiellaceae bacterium]|nr:YbdK family carboxylate-amine ligase [Gaiellaceae bacterium]